MPGALAVLLKVREGPVKAGVAYSHVRGCIRILGYPEELLEKKENRNNRDGIFKMRILICNLKARLSVSLRPAGP